MSKYRIMEMGTVSSVFPHSDQNDKDNYECNVKLKNKDLELRKVPLATQGIGLAHVPSVGDMVLVAFLEGDINAPVIIGRLYNEAERPPVSKDEEIVFQPPYKQSSDKRRLHMELPGGMVMTVTDDSVKVQAGKTLLTIKVDGEVTVDSNADVTIKAKGDMTLSASNLNIKAEQALKVNAGSTADIESNATMTLKGATINLN